jgi:hypothetical protein
MVSLCNKIDTLIWIKFSPCRWSFYYFFYNRKLKRVVSFRCYCTSKLSADDFLIGAASDGEEEDALIDMDI